MKRALNPLLVFAMLCAAIPTYAQEACGELTASYGPFDYRKATKEQKDLVEGAHFLPHVERLIRGHNSAGPGGDIAYTLRVFPNHPRALLSMMKLAEKEKTNKPFGSTYTIDCWFDRALRFQPEDGVIRMIYGTYLARKDKSKEAIEQLEEARHLLGEEDGNAHYNLGLAYCELKQYDKALEHAHKAYALGFDLPGLRNKLQRAGKWRDPPKPEPPPAEAATPVTEPAPVPQAPAGDAPSARPAQ